MNQREGTCFYAEGFTLKASLASPCSLITPHHKKWSGPSDGWVFEHELGMSRPLSSFASWEPSFSAPLEPSTRDGWETLVSWDCCNKVAWIKWLLTTEICSLPVVEARCPNLVSLGQDQRFGGAPLPKEARWRLEASALYFFQHLRLLAFLGL